ncbi:diacylglycerol/lipid kinase family protein [Bdellovibrio sp. HCB185ZH]|uniref:diacylglycerol/lipid kinase family protein n=1 Tax=Bdellovibrio sp. HCB185ZH TaxID=3394235 RepID=UPI0039A46585
MRVSILINPKAGSSNQGQVEAIVREALFRCDLHFAAPKTLEELDLFLAHEMLNKTNALIICGGDGTINVTFQTMIRIHERLGFDMPPVTLVRSGTANDLAERMGISTKIHQAVRNILEGTTKNIDVIEVTGDGKKSYMLTNGGLGLPAMTAEMSNEFRSYLQQRSDCPKATLAFKFLAKQGYSMVKKMGPQIYSMMALEAIRTWDPTDWNLEVDIPHKSKFETTAPIILVNNQPNVASTFTPAPFTSNTDGTMNLLISESSSQAEHVRTALNIRRGTAAKLPYSKSYELKEFSLKTKNSKRPLTFFGDGEVLHKGVSELTVKCLHRFLPIVVAAK